MRGRGLLTSLVTPRVRGFGAAVAARAAGREFLFALPLLGVFFLALAVRLPMADDEYYYWCWSRDLSPSYFDHPPMTAYLIRASTAVFGHSVLAVRLPACLATVAGLAVVGWLTRPQHLLRWVVVTPAYTIGAVLVTPDTPLLLFWALYLGWLVVAHRRLDEGRVPWWLWLVGGAVLGCGALGKYTMALAVPAGFATFLLARKPLRVWLPGYVAHGVVAFVFVLPVLWFNVEHDFAPLKFQWGHAMANPAKRAWPFGEFVGLQLLMFGTLPFVLFPWAVWNLRALAADPRLRACLGLYAVPFGFFLLKATQGPMEGNWGLVAYLGFWPVAAVWYDRARGSAWWRRATVLAFALPAGSAVLLMVHLAYPLPVLSAGRDRITRQGVKFDVAPRVVEAAREHAGGQPVFTPTYQMTAMFRYHGLDARQIAGATRPSHFTLRPDGPAGRDRTVVISEGPLRADLVAGFRKPVLLRTFPVEVRGKTLTYYHLLLYVRDDGCGGP